MLRTNFPGRKAARKIDEERRKEDRAILSTDQQLRKLDNRLGYKIGAVSERTRLEARWRTG